MSKFYETPEMESIELNAMNILTTSPDDEKLEGTQNTEIEYEDGGGLFGN